MRKYILLFSIATTLFITSGFTERKPLVAGKIAMPAAKVITESLPAEPKLTLYKQNVLATYYADKFNGRKTSSGERFHNSKYTAAHMKLPFGTMVRVTNESNGKFVDVKVNDRGPFSKKLEIDLTKKAFMEIASSKNHGTFKVKIEIIEKV
jgi:rare lipoprotein A|nr:septal ring lytic transglycosylase RlpA family protein [Flavobacterium sp. MK4S-17]